MVDCDIDNSGVDVYCSCDEVVYDCTGVLLFCDEELLQLSQSIDNNRAPRVSQYLHDPSIARRSVILMILKFSSQEACR